MMDIASKTAFSGGLLTKAPATHAENAEAANQAVGIQVGSGRGGGHLLSIMIELTAPKRGMVAPREGL
jgi:hypothetical protein